MSSIHRLFKAPRAECCSFQCITLCSMSGPSPALCPFPGHAILHQCSKLCAAHSKESVSEYLLLLPVHSCSVKYTGSVTDEMNWISSPSLFSHFECSLPFIDQWSRRSISEPYLLLFHEHLEQPLQVVQMFRCHIVTSQNKPAFCKLRALQFIPKLVWASSDHL